MRKEIFLFFFFIGFSVSIPAQTAPKKILFAPTVADTIQVTAVLLDSVDVIPYCGEFVINLSLSYSITASSDLSLVGKTLSISTGDCPRERFGPDYFHKGQTYAFPVKRVWVNAMGSQPGFTSYTYAGL